MEEFLVCHAVKLDFVRSVYVWFMVLSCKFVSDNSEKAFYKELVKVIEASDVILEVLDARDPLGTRCVDMEKMVTSSGPDKRLVLLLNKIGMLQLRVLILLAKSVILWW